MRTYITNSKEGKVLKIGVEYHEGDSGGYYVVFDEVLGEQVEVKIAYPIARLLFEHEGERIRNEGTTK